MKFTFLPQEVVFYHFPDLTSEESCTSSISFIIMVAGLKSNIPAALEKMLLIATQALVKEKVVRLSNNI